MPDLRYTAPSSLADLLAGTRTSTVDPAAGNFGAMLAARRPMSAQPGVPAETSLFGGWLGNDRDALIRATATMQGMRDNDGTGTTTLMSPGVSIGAGPIDLSVARDLMSMRSPFFSGKQADTRVGASLTQPIGDVSLNAMIERSPSSLATLFGAGLTVPIGEGDYQGQLSADFQRNTAPGMKPDNRAGVRLRLPF